MFVGLSMFKWMPKDTSFGKDTFFNQVIIFQNQFAVLAGMLHEENSIVEAPVCTLYLALTQRHAT